MRAIRRWAAAIVNLQIPANRGGNYDYAVSILQIARDQAEAIVHQLEKDGPRCHMCEAKLTPDTNCGGDCVYCMAEAGDPDCRAHLARRFSEPKP